MESEDPRKGVFFYVSILVTGTFGLGCHLGWFQTGYIFPWRLEWSG